MKDRQTLIDLVEKGMIAIGILGTLLAVLAEGRPWLAFFCIILLCLLLVALFVDIVYYALPIGIPWPVVRRGVASLLEQFSFDRFSPDLVIGVGRSGSIIGATIAANLGHCPFIAIDVQHDRSSGLRKVRMEEPFSLNAEKLKNKKILLTFAYVRTAKTLQKALEYIRANGVPEEKITLATLFLDLQSVPDIENLPRFYVAYKRIVKWWSAVPWRLRKEYDWR